MSKRIILLGLLTLLVISISLNVYYKITNQPKITTNHCGIAQKIFIDSSQERYLIFCTKGVYVGENITDSVNDYHLIESDQSFSDLFFYNKQSVITTAQVFPQTNPKFLALIANFDTGLTYKQAVGVYQINGSEVTRAFKKRFDDVSGRWTSFELSDTEPEITIIGDFGALGCSGCRIEWRDYFKLDETSNTFVLNNSSHISDYKTLLDKYSKYSLEGATEQSKQTFIRAKDTVQKIIDGKNIMFSNP